VHFVVHCFEVVHDKVHEVVVEPGHDWGARWRDTISRRLVQRARAGLGFEGQPVDKVHDKG
jgi:hypothetical protein